MLTPPVSTGCDSYSWAERHFLAGPYGPPRPFNVACAARGSGPARAGRTPHISGYPQGSPSYTCPGDRPDHLAYLDHAATTPMRPEAVAAMQPFLAGHVRQPVGGPRRAPGAAKTALEEAREQVADGLGCAPGRGRVHGRRHRGRQPRGQGRGPGRRGPGASATGVVTTAFEHKGVLASCDRLEGEGFGVRYAGVGPGGVVDLDALADARSTSGRPSSR